MFLNYPYPCRTPRGVKQPAYHSLEFYVLLLYWDKNEFTFRRLGDFSVTVFKDWCDRNLEETSNEQI